MKIPGMQILKKAEQKGNEAEVPLAENLGLVQFFKLMFKEVSEDHVMAFAGNLTYKALFAIFPFFTFLLSLLGLFNATKLVNTMLNKLSGVLPPGAFGFIENQLLSIAKSQAESAFTLAAIISILLALWGVSGAFRSVMEAMNVMYEVEEDRPFWKEYGISIFISLAVIVLMLGALGIVIFGGSIGGGLAAAIGLGSMYHTVWSIAQWPIVAGIVLLAFAVIYYFAPAAKQKWRWISPGSILAFVFWLVFSLLFSFYVGNFGSYNETYGSLAGAIILLLYIYYSAVIMLVGAEMNQVIEWHIPGGKDEGEKVPQEDSKPNVQPTRSAPPPTASQRQQEQATLARSDSVRLEESVTMTTSGVEEVAMRLLGAFHDLSGHNPLRPVPIGAPESPPNESAAKAAGVEPESTECDVAVRYLLNQGYIKETYAPSAYTISVQGIDRAREMRGLANDSTS
jgi:membrane protein